MPDQALTNNLFASGLTAATMSITANGHLVQKVWFPREILPLAAVGSNLVTFLFQLIISPIAITVNFLASLPGAIVALFRGELNSRVPATILIAMGAFIPTVTDSLNRFGSTELYESGKLLGVIFLFAGFLVSTETFQEIRVPFTHIVLRTRSRIPEPPGRGPS